MKATFAKVLGLLLVLAMTLSGCNLIEVDAKMEADERIAALDKLYSKVVAGYDGGEVTVSEAIGDFNSYYNEMAYMYQYYFGSEISYDEVVAMMEEVLADHVRMEIAAAKFDEGYELSEEELATLESDVQYSYDQNLAVAAESAEGKTEDQKKEYARVDLREYGVDYDSLYANMLMSTKVTRMEEILREEIAEVSEEELQAAFDAKVEEQRASFTDGTSLENAMTGEEETVYYMPEGYRTVKHILVMPEAGISSAYSDAVYALETAQGDLSFLEAELAAANDGEIAEGERSAEEIQAEIDAIEADMVNLQAAAESAKQACLDAAKATTDAVYARLEAGEDFESLIAEFGEDPGMQNEPTMSRGYYVSAASQNWEPNFRDAAMALEKVGDYTLEPVVSGSGVHIILYNSDVPAGTVELSEVRDALYAETLESMQAAHCEATINAWVEEANPVYDVAGFEAIFSEGAA